MWKRFVWISCAVAMAGQLAAQKCEKGPVCVEMGTPSVWSLQQAHYLLERNRMLNRTLRAKPLGELDANTTNAERYDIRQSYLGISGEFDQKALVENSLALRKREDQVTAKAANDARIRQMRAKRDALAVERAERQYELQILQSDPERKGEAAAKQAEVDRLSAQVNILNQQIADQGSASVEALTLNSTSATAAGAADKLTGTSLDAGKALAARIGTKEATLAASAMLDNNLNLQNEILAKQLTLLRDEAGPDQNVIFLELPQSIYTANGKGNDYMVRTKWRVMGLIARKDKERYGENERAVNLCTLVKRAKGIPTDYVKMIDALQCAHLMDKDSREFEYVAENGHAARAVELIPSKTYLHVNDFHATTRTKNIVGVAKTLIGIGLRLDYQSRREAFENLLQQEVYASGLGKGSAEFGWVFGPEPGKKHINPGVRTTFAVMHVPSNTYGLHIQKEHCYFKRKSDDIDSNCTFKATQDKLLAVPHAGNGFYLSRVFYEKAPVGGVATVYLHGEDFSPQTTVMVDGFPLHKALSVGDPRLAAEHNIPAAGAAAEGQRYWGEYEIVNPGLIVVRVRSAANAAAGTPDIAVLSPNKAISLHRMTNLHVNGRIQPIKDSPMFEAGLQLTAMKIQGRQGGKVKLMVTGGPFDGADLVDFAGKPATARIDARRPGVMELEVDRPASSTWTLLVTSHLRKAPATESMSIADPLTPDSGGKAVDVELRQVKGQPAQLHFAIPGNNFYAATVPKVEGAESCGAATWKTVDGRYKADDDGTKAQFIVEDPPACVRVSYKAAKLDVDGAKYWPVHVKRPEKAAVEEASNN